MLEIISAIAVSTLIVACFCASSAEAFFNPYPRYQPYSDGGDPGHALYLTDYIDKNQADLARNLSRVHHREIPVDIRSHSGYFTVNRKTGSNMFFWYFEAANKPADAPVLLWLQGGPGASSLFGLFTENGPFMVQDDLSLKRRQYSWHLDHHLIYIDNPVGSGYSEVSDDAGYARNEQDVGRDLLAAMQQFFTVFPELRSHEFYITGESYGGKYVPALGYAIHEANLAHRRNSQPEQLINLAGLAIGDGWTDPLHQLNYGDYLYQLGLIDANVQAVLKSLENNMIESIKKEDYLGAYRTFDGLINKGDGSIFQNITGLSSYYNYINPDLSIPEYETLGKFVQTSETRRAIHVGNNNWHDLFTQKNQVGDYMEADQMQSVAPWVSVLLSHYRMLIYNGQLDIICAYPMAVNYLRHLNFTGAVEYRTAKRHIWYVDGQVAGYWKKAGNLTELLVRDSGHMVPTNQPKRALDMILRLTKKKGF